MLRRIAAFFTLRSVSKHEGAKDIGPGRPPPSRRFGAGQLACAKPPQDEVGMKTVRSGADEMVESDAATPLERHAARTRLGAAPLPRTSASSNSAAAIARSSASRSSLAVSRV